MAYRGKPLAHQCHIQACTVVQNNCPTSYRKSSSLMFLSHNLQTSQMHALSCTTQIVHLAYIKLRFLVLAKFASIMKISDNITKRILNRYIWK